MRSRHTWWVVSGLAATLILGLALSWALVNRGSSVRQVSGGMVPTIVPDQEVQVEPIEASGIQRGDLVVVEDPDRPGMRHIRRVVAVAGDRLSARQGVPEIDGVAVPRCRVGEYKAKFERYPNDEVVGTVYVEFLGDAAYLVLKTDTRTTAPLEGPFDVASGEVMVLGDNRDNAPGSPFWGTRRGVGFRVDRLLGRVTGFARSAPSLAVGSPQALQDGLATCLRDRHDLGPSPP